MAVFIIFSFSCFHSIQWWSVSWWYFWMWLIETFKTTTFWFHRERQHLSIICFIVFGCFYFISRFLGEKKHFFSSFCKFRLFLYKRYFWYFLNGLFVILNDFLSCWYFYIEFLLIVIFKNCDWNIFFFCYFYVNLTQLFIKFLLLSMLTNSKVDWNLTDLKSGI